MPITVYLDSSDFSRLACARDDSHQYWVTRKRLLEFAARQDIAFVYSGVHISEMSPTAAEVTAPAEERANLLSLLCGRHALKSLDEVLRSETACLAGLASQPLNLNSFDGEWFPPVGDELLPHSQVGALRERLEGELAARHLNSALRRRLSRLLFYSDGTPRPRWLQLLRSAGGDELIASLRSSYPMRPRDVNVLMRYVAGFATADAAREAFMESLRDPAWMMKWFRSNYDTLTPLTMWLRGPAKEFCESMHPLISELRGAQSSFSDAMTAQLRHGFEAMEDAQVLSTANDFLGRWYPTATAAIHVQAVDEHARGIATMIRTMFRVLRDAVAAQPRDLKKSDLLDAIHAVYSPYVDVFRADRYMAPHIAGLVERWATAVVPRLEDLPDVIDSRLGASATD